MKPISYEDLIEQIVKTYEQVDELEKCFKPIGLIMGDKGLFCDVSGDIFDTLEKVYIERCGEDYETYIKSESEWAAECLFEILEADISTRAKALKIYNGLTYDKDECENCGGDCVVEDDLRKCNRKESK